MEGNFLQVSTHDLSYPPEYGNMDKRCLLRGCSREICRPILLSRTANSPKSWAPIACKVACQASFTSNGARRTCNMTRCERWYTRWLYLQKRRRLPQQCCLATKAPTARPLADIPEAVINEVKDTDARAMLESLQAVEISLPECTVQSTFVGPPPDLVERKGKHSLHAACMLTNHLSLLIKGYVRIRAHACMGV